MKEHKLSYLRVAHKQKDGADGVLYMHQWATGYQELVFVNEEAAKKFEDRLNGRKA